MQQWLSKETFDRFVSINTSDVITDIFAWPKPHKPQDIQEDTRSLARLLRWLVECNSADLVSATALLPGVQEITLYRRAAESHDRLLANNSSTSTSPVCASEDDIPSQTSPSKSPSDWELRAESWWRNVVVMCRHLVIHSHALSLLLSTLKRFVSEFIFELWFYYVILKRIEFFVYKLEKLPMISDLGQTDTVNVDL